jgi:S1-C subfamily serine protease
MRPGDIIVTIDGKPVPDFEFVLTHVGEFRPGHEVAFGVLRGGEKFDRKVVLGEWNQ